VMHAVCMVCVSYIWFCRMRTTDVWFMYSL